MENNLAAIFIQKVRRKSLTTPSWTLRITNVNVPSFITFNNETDRSGGIFGPLAEYYRDLVSHTFIGSQVIGSFNGETKMGMLQRSVSLIIDLHLM